MSRALLLTFVLVASSSWADLQPVAPPPAASASPTVSLDFQGNLGEGLRKLAEAGGLNLVATGDLDQKVEIHLRQVNAEQALRNVAEAHGLTLTSKDGIYAVQKAKGEKERSFFRGKKKWRGPLFGHSRSIEVAEGQRHDDAVVFGGSLTVKGQVDGDAVAFGGSVDVSGRVTGDVVAFGSQVFLRPGAVVEGDVTAFGGSVHREPGAQVGGDISAFGGKGDEDAPEGEEAPRHRLHALPHFLFRFAAFFGLGFGLFLLLPERMKEVEQELEKKPWLSGLLGMVAWVASIPLTLLLVVTVIGIPVAIVLWLALILATCMGVCAVALALGRRIPGGTTRSRALTLALGLVLVLLTWAIPFAGPLFIFATASASLGAIIRTRFGQPPRGQPQPWSE